MVKAKKHLGQHFLIDDSISFNIASALKNTDNYTHVVEVGPGTGALTKHLVANKNYTTIASEIDRESVAYLKQHYPKLEVIEESFLGLDFDKITDGNLAVAGNFPYNISTQILFKVYEEKHRVPEVVGMFQKEVAERVAEKPGSKKYGILSVLLQAFYDIEYLFTVEPEAFEPPPKVRSGVIRMVRNNVTDLGCDEKKFKLVIKTAFNQRRKMLRSSLKPFLNDEQKAMELFTKRPEQLGVPEFIEITNLLFA
jgi:16S rRNA (adenine1518-N6/adenine1519-N6)-dimethyltransferase